MRVSVLGVEGEEDRLIIGVQWHPEFLLFDRAQQALFRALVKEAKARQRDTTASS